jgi:hypothetical protein
MKKLFAVAVAVLAIGLLAVSCGGDKQTKKAPVYPACDSTENCSEKGEVCVDGMCKECGTNKDCAAKGACLQCAGNKCEPKANCCKSDADCPEGQKCKAKPGKKEGTCGTL